MTPLPFRYTRRKLTDAGLLPLSKLGKFTLLLIALEILIWTVQQALHVSHATAAAAGLDDWITALTFVNVVLFIFLLLRWARRVLMWRLRNRLAVTYIFIGVVPVVLVAIMAWLAGYMLAAQFSIFVATADFHAETDNMQRINFAIASELADHFRHGDLNVSTLSAIQGEEEAKGLEVTVWYRGRASTYNAEKKTSSTPLTLPMWAGEEFAGVVFDPDQQLYLRAVNRVPVGAETMMVISSRRLDSNLLNEIFSNLGAVMINTANFYRGAVSNISLGTSGIRNPGLPGAEKLTSLQQASNNPKLTARGGKLPAQTWPLDREVGFGTLFPVRDWITGKTYSVYMQVLTRVSILYERLFSSFSELGPAIRTMLVVLAITFAVIEFLALLVGLGITRTITRSVAALYQGTERVNRGDFRHRIAVKSNDQLAALETSFNSMTASLEDLIAEQKEKQRLQSELAIAQEVQGQLFPKADLQTASLELHGVCLPARTVSGDYYDFLPLAAEKMCIALGDISGKGISAALLMATVHSAVRVYELGGLPDRAALVAAGAAAFAAQQKHGSMNVELASPAASSNRSGIHSPGEVLWLLNRHLFHSTPPEKYATLFLGIFDGGRSSLTYSNGGHLPPLIIGADRQVRRLDVGGTVIGLFDNMQYEEKTVELRRGDVFVAYSDGITEPENEFGEFGEYRLLEILRENHALPLPRISELVTTAVLDWNGSREQPDDITLVLARAR